jgi:hypothetical protein
VSATSLALAFRVEGAEPLAFAAVPTLRFALAIESAGPEPIRSLLLDVQLQIAARQRSYAADDETGLLDLFGEPERWGTTLRTLLWTRTTLVVPAFEASTAVGLDVPCTYDFEVTAARYLAALSDGDVPLEFLFSGTAFYGEGALRAERISWESEASYRLPVAVWRATMDQHFPGSAWLRLSRESLDRLAAYRGRHALPSWEATIDALLDG